MVASKRDRYWEERSQFIYYHVVKVLAQGIGGKSVIDVGSGGCPYLDWFEAADHKTSVDLRTPYTGRGIEPVQDDFLTWPPDLSYDLVLCLQVLEHVPNAKQFAQKLLGLGKTAIVSVPYKWPFGRTASHVHDPVDEGKLLDWFGRQPNFSYLCREIQAPTDRLIMVYDYLSQPWNSLNERKRLINELRQARKSGIEQRDQRDDKLLNRRV